MHSFVPSRCRTSQYLSTFVLLSVSLWNYFHDPVFDRLGVLCTSPLQLSIMSKARKYDFFIMHGNIRSFGKQYDELHFFASKLIYAPMIAYCQKCNFRSGRSNAVEIESAHMRL